MTEPRRAPGFAAILILGMVILILITTLSAGVPAYLLARTQLEQQARSQVRATTQATLSLYEAEAERMLSLTQLLAERPSLEQLIRQGSPAALEAYLAAFQSQSRIDILQLCEVDGVAVTAVVPCLPSGSVGFLAIDGRAALLAAEAIGDETSAPSIGTAVTGIWLDQQFLLQLSDNTGVEQSLFSTDGRALGSTIEGAATGREPAVAAAGLGEGQTLETVAGTYYAQYVVLDDPAGQPGLTAESALPVAALKATERRALGILVASTGLVALLGGLLGAWFIRRLTSPLRELTQVAEQISRGDMVPIPALSGPAEIVTLSTSLERSQAAMLQAVEERSEARDWLSTLVQSIVEGVVTFDTRGRVTFMSHGAERMVGWSSEEALGRPVNEVFPLVDGGTETFLDRIPPAGEKREIEVVARSGKRIVMATTGARLIPPAGDTVQVALVLRDVTEEQALRNLRSFFLANISHEFRTPLSTLNASIELLLDEADELSPAEVRELIKPTHLSLFNLQTLIDNLLESSSMEAGSFAIRPRLTNLNEVIAGALAIVQPLVERRRQAISISEPAQLVQLYADPAKLTQALVNLLNNASKYGPTDRPIDVLVELRGEWLRLSVADRGPGIAAEDRVNVFRRFVRLHAESHEQYGIGLGLYVVKRIAEAHQGRVGVDDRPGGGALFWIELPYADMSAIASGATRVKDESTGS